MRLSGASCRQTPDLVSLQAQARAQRVDLGLRRFAAPPRQLLCVYRIVQAGDALRREAVLRQALRRKRRVGKPPVACRETQALNFSRKLSLVCA